MATSSLDSTVKVWDLSSEEMIDINKLSDMPPAYIDWSFEGKSKIAIACQHPESTNGEKTSFLVSTSIIIWNFVGSSSSGMYI
jgi:hypothetical protein